MIRTLYLMPTHLCNGECDYCYLDEEEKQKQGTDAFFHDVLDRFIDHRDGLAISGAEAPQLRFIGGEPYLRLELVQALTARFLTRFPRSMVLINTNGTLIRGADLTPFEASRDRVYHVVSLDGPARIHNARRRLKSGGDAHDSVVAGIAALRERGLQVHVNMVLDDLALEGLEELMVQLKRRMGLTTLSVSLLQSRRGAGTVDVKYAWLAAAYAIADRHGITLSGHHRLLLGPRIPGLRCRAGERSALVSSDRELNLCQRFLGRDEGVAIKEGRPLFDALPSTRTRDDSCYSPDARRLGERLYRMYRRRYPGYLEVTPLDRILYGTI